jgi:hypothetical protein
MHSLIGWVDGEQVEITVDYSVIDVTTFSERDPGWVYIDRQGHKHSWYRPKGRKGQLSDYSWRLPSLRRVEYICRYSHDYAPIYGVHYYCKKCGELIKPGWRASLYRRFIQGPQSYCVNGKQVDKQVALLLLNKMKEQAT